MSIDVVADAIRNERITFARGHSHERHILLAQAGDAASRRHAPRDVTVGEGVVMLLTALSAFSALEILSLFRRGEGPHGVAQGARQVVNAVDISQFAGVTVDLGASRITHYRRNPDEWARYKADLIHAVATMIRLFPEGTYAVGFPRPLGGARLDSAMDIFFPVTSHDQVSIGAPVRRMLQPARAEIEEAQARGRPFGVAWRSIFPDARDHVHIEAIAPAPVRAPARVPVGAGAQRT